MYYLELCEENNHRHFKDILIYKAMQFMMKFKDLGKFQKF